MSFPIEDPDIHILRFMALMVSYFVSEPNVFLQLLSYRLCAFDYWLNHWILHFISLCLYATTRAFISILFWREYIMWCTDIGPTQSALYYIVFAVAPLLNILMNVTQLTTVSALRHIIGKIKCSESARYVRFIFSFCFFWVPCLDS